MTALVSSRIYDEPPQNVTFPYARFGDIAPDAFDTDTKEGAMVGISIEAHSRSASGRVEAVQIVEAVKEVRDLVAEIRDNPKSFVKLSLF